MEKSEYPPPPPSYDSLPGIVQQPSYGMQPPPPAMPMQGTPAAAAQWMARPQGGMNCPPGLEYLCQLDRLFLQQEVEVSPGGMYGPVANCNWYKVLNGNGQQVFTAIEGTPQMDGGCVCLPGQRGYNVHGKDNIGNEVMRISRDPLCCSCCPCLGCEHLVQIEAPVGHVIGYFKSIKNMSSISFTISNPEDEVVFTMSFPCCATSSYLHQQEFDINSKDGVTQVAKITKHWNRIEYFFRLKKFSIYFPMDLDERMKAVLLGTIFAIDVMYFPPLQRVQRM
ncbi:phospholipid scramblase 1-like [Mercenaria mercenaria]|uniref:phospholipid scramblase 1-like n=1 Tax=Mercenaria mercenaria TaxID=6596 RepID=UPI00234E5339|nr:phospholipid scramblase 1-like [Mercenaria mercenaria]XP_045163261.2 phospholipid scramblase 1-like [Mercenaria mercenaria]